MRRLILCLFITWKRKRQHRDVKQASEHFHWSCGAFWMKLFLFADTLVVCRYSFCPFSICLISSLYAASVTFCSGLLRVNNNLGWWIMDWKSRLGYSGNTAQCLLKGQRNSKMTDFQLFVLKKRGKEGKGSKRGLGRQAGRKGMNEQKKDNFFCSWHWESSPFSK